MDHATRAVLAQRHVDGAPGEVPGFRPLLADLAGVVVTADALHIHPGAAEFLVDGKQAQSLLVVKANQPTLGDRCAGLAWHRVPVADRTRDRGHGRLELRTLKAVTVHHFGFPARGDRLDGVGATDGLGGRLRHAESSEQATQPHDRQRRNPVQPCPRSRHGSQPADRGSTGCSRSRCSHRGAGR